MNPDELQAAFDKIQIAMKTLGEARGQMDNLTRMGQNVTFDDLMKSAEGLVGVGLDPGTMAGMLADASEMSNNNPKLLAEWVQSKDVELHQREAELKLVASQIYHQMAVTGVKMLAQAQMAENPMMGGEQPMQQPSDNALMGGGALQQGGAPQASQLMGDSNG